MAGPQRLAWPGILPFGLEAAVTLGPEGQLLALEALDAAEGLPREVEGWEETLAAAELRRGIVRCVAGVTDQLAVCTRLRRFAAVWQRSRPAVVLWRPTLLPLAAHLRQGPRVWVERVGRHLAEVSWSPSSDMADEVDSFEVKVRRYRDRHPSTRTFAGAGGHLCDDPRFESLGCFSAPGGAEARSYTLHRLRPSEWHRVCVRALGPGRSWASAWSTEEAFKTISVEGAADAFLAISERRICAGTCGTYDSSIGAPDSLSGSRLSDSVSDSSISTRVEVVDQLNTALGLMNYHCAVKELLDARLYRGGQSEFVRLGARYSRPPETRELRMQRLRLVIAAKELYGSQYAEGNAWSMGPFYAEEVGRHMLESIASRGGA